MQNGTVIQTIGKGSKWYEKIVYWFIRKESGGPETHSQVWLDGFVYEVGWPKGFNRRKEIPSESDGKYFLVPTRELTLYEVTAMEDFYKDKIRQGIKYGTAKLLISFILSFTRPLWEKIRWMPLEDDRVWGEYCSAAVDQAFKFAGIDLLPGFEEITTPRDLTKSTFLRRTK